MKEEKINIHIKDLNNLQLSNGECLANYKIAYTCLGKLSPKQDNVILICHSLSGNAHVAGLDPKTNKKGWWEEYVGAEKAIDTNHFFVIASNVLGSCYGSTGPSSINPDTKEAYGMSFPSLTISDMVSAQVALLDSLGIKKIFTVIGASLGGMLAMVWATQYSHRVQNCIPIASCMAHSSMQIAFNEIGRQAILSDSKWRQGNYYSQEGPEHGLAVARMIGHVTYLSEYSMRQKFGRQLQRPSQPEDYFPAFFRVESYLQYQGESFVRHFDPNSYLYITKALDMFDLLEGKSSYELFKRVDTCFLVISFESDWLYPPSQSKELARVLKRANRIVSYINLETLHGHDSFLLPNKKFSKVLGNYLKQNYKKSLSP